MTFLKIHYFTVVFGLDVEGANHSASLTPFPEFTSPSTFVSIFKISGPKKLMIGVSSLASFRYELPVRTKGCCPPTVMVIMKVQASVICPALS